MFIYNWFISSSRALSPGIFNMLLQVIYLCLIIALSTVTSY